MTTYHLDELASKVGEEVGVSDWVTIDQARIDQFADATGDHQWIHVDAQRAAAGPYGSTIAHGYLSLSLLPALVGPLLHVEGVAMRLNYGLEKVRFPHPVPVGSRVRARVSIASVEPTRQGVRLGQSCVIEIDGVEKPACVAHTLTLLIPATPA